MFSSQRGFTIVEILVGATIAFAGLTATIGTMVGSRHTQVAADRTEVLAQEARAFAEDMTSLNYSQLAMNSNGVQASALTKLPSQEAARFSIGAGAPTFITKTSDNGSVTEPIVSTAGGDAAGTVEFGPSLESAGSYKVLVWRIVSWRDEDCAVAAATSACTGAKNTKRVTVALRAATSDGQGQGNVMWSSAVAIDPTDASDPYACVTQCGTVDSKRYQYLYLYDTDCGETVRKPQVESPVGSGGHPVHNTAARNPGSPGQNSYCVNTNKPDLMGGQPGGQAGDPLRRYSRDIFATGPASSPVTYGYGAGSRVIRRSDGCQSQYAPSSSNPSKFHVHSWASPKVPTGGLRLMGLSILELYGGTYMAAAQSYMTLCVTVGMRKEAAANQPATDEKVLYRFYCQVNPWPRGRASGNSFPDGMQGMPVVGRKGCRFNPQGDRQNGDDSIVWPASGGYLVPKDYRVTLTISACGSACGDKEYSRNDAALFYDHPSYPTRLNLATDQEVW